MGVPAHRLHLKQPHRMPRWACVCGRRLAGADSSNGLAVVMRACFAEARVCLGPGPGHRLGGGSLSIVPPSASGGLCAHLVSP